MNKGKVIEVENKNFIVVTNCEIDDNTYTCIVSEEKPTEVKFIRQLDENRIEIINNQELKYKILEEMKDINIDL